MNVVLANLDVQEAIDKIYTACRTCYNAGKPEDMYKEIKDREREVGVDELITPLDNEKKLKLINQVLRSMHWSTVEHVTVTFFISGVSRALTHQLVRHRHSNVSQQSQRYVEFKEGVFEYVTPSKIEKNEEALNTFKMAMESASTYYRALTKLGIPAEDARAVLPNACCTNLTFTVNLRELIHICNERLCTCAQAEIRQMVKLMADRVSHKLPFMKEYLVPKCVSLGYCNEPASRSCGRKPLKAKFFSEEQ